MEKVKKIVLIGASGFVGSALLNEALNRGFEVTAVVRHPEKIKIENENLKVVKADVSALDEVAAVCKGADAVISAFNPGWNNPDIYDETIKVYLTIIDGVKKAGVNRFLMVGGAGSLFIAPGLRLMDSGEVPENILPGVEEKVMVYAMVNSITSLGNAASVQFTVEGKRMDTLRDFDSFHLLLTNDYSLSEGKRKSQ